MLSRSTGGRPPPAVADDAWSARHEWIAECVCNCLGAAIARDLCDDGEEEEDGGGGGADVSTAPNCFGRPYSYNGFCS